MPADRDAGATNLSPAQHDDARERRLLALRHQLEPAVHERLHALREGPEEAAVPSADDPETAAAEEARRELEAALAESEAQTLRGVREALHRLRRGTYGICADCGRPIPRPRLEALPFAARCRACQEKAEAGRDPARHLEPFYVDEESEAA